MELEDIAPSQHALQVAFETMKERCKQLQARLATVEEENTSLRLNYVKKKSNDLVKINGINEKNVIQKQQVGNYDFTAKNNCNKQQSYL